jgi:hypothetical protein
MMPLSQFLLMSLHHTGERGASVGILTGCARAQLDDTITEPQVERELRGLADKRLVSLYEQPILGKRWRITALGTDTLREAGL